MRIRRVAVLGLLPVVAAMWIFTAAAPEAGGSSKISTPTPTYMMTPRGVEGDDGSLGGPVFDKHHQVTPTYRLRKAK